MSFKMSMPLGKAGALLQDRPSCIVADTREAGPRAADRHQRVHPKRRPRSRLAPARALPVGPNAPKADADKGLSRRGWHAPRLTPIRFQRHQQRHPDRRADVTESVIEIQSRIQARGFPALEQSDFLYASEGLATS